MSEILVGHDRTKSGECIIDAIYRLVSENPSGISVRLAAESCGVKISTARYFMFLLKKNGRIHICRYEPMSKGSYTPIYAVGLAADAAMPRRLKLNRMNLKRGREQAQELSKLFPDLPDSLLFMMGYTRKNVPSKHVSFVVHGS